MKVYTRIHWNTLTLFVMLMVVVCLTGLMIQLQPLTIIGFIDRYWGVIPSYSTNVAFIGSKYEQSELPFPDDLQPVPLSLRRATNEKGASIMIRKPKGIDLDPKTIPKLKIWEHGHNASQYSSRPPGAILLGFGKCGTSALLEFLDLHPDIVTLDWEPDYFCDRMYPKYDLQWYVKRMPPSLPHQITIEKSPCYIVEHDSHLRMFAMNSSLKLMVLVRDPVVRVISEYGHYSATERYWGRTPIPLVDRITVKATGKLNDAQLLKTGHYHPHLEYLLKVFPREQLLVLDGDKLISDPLSQIAKVEQFLGVSHFITSDHVYMDQEKGFYCVIKPDDRTKKCLGKSKGRKHEKLDQDLEKMLSGFYLPYNEMFFNLIGQRFEWS